MLYKITNIIDNNSWISNISSTRKYMKRVNTKTYSVNNFRFIFSFGTKFFN